jgi:rod shape-determining protein MreD
MSNISTAKLLILIYIVNLIEGFIAPLLVKAYINIPITFLIFSFAIYKSRFNTNAFYAFLFGLCVDFISDSPIGMNAALFLMMAYVVNSYANTFKLFSSIQICLFFSGSSVFYIGFSHLFINLENFSYLILFISFVINTFLFLIVSMLRFYFPFSRLN